MFIFILIHIHFTDPSTALGMTACRSLLGMTTCRSLLGMTVCRSLFGMTVSRHCEVRRTVAISDAEHYNERCAKSCMIKIYAKMSVFVCQHALCNDIITIFVILIVIWNSFLSS